MRARAFAPALLLACRLATVHAQEFGAATKATFEHDADHFSTARLGADALFDYQSPWKYLGIGAQEYLYSQSGWHQSATAVVGAWRDQARATLAGINAEAGAIQVSGRTRPIGDVDWSLRPGAATGFELLASGGLVETQRAIEQAIGYTFWGASAEQRFAGRFTVVALAGYQPFTDRNGRSHLRGRLVWDAAPDLGINLQARWRQYHDRTTDVGRAYFDPESYQQWLGVVGFRKRRSGWTASGAVGAGQEIIRNGGTTTQATYLAELNVEGPIGGNARLAVQALYNRSAGFENSPDYWWNLLSVTLILPL